MKTHAIAMTKQKSKLAYVYTATLFLLVLSGFAQMPIFKRYYIADIPGLGWLAQFYTTHFLHYLAATAMIAIAAFYASAYLMMERRHRKLTLSGKVRVLFLSGLLLSGALLVVKNSLFVPFSPAVGIILLLVHLGLTMGFLIAALYCRLRGHPYTAAHTA